MVALGACGDDDSGSDSGSPSGSASAPAGSGSASEPHGHEDGSAVTIPASEATVTVEVSLKDFDIVGLPKTIQGQKILFKVKNDGSQPHELVIKQGTKELAATAELSTGESADLAIELPAGRYSAACLVGSGGGRHDKLGMVTNFSVA